MRLSRRSLLVGATAALGLGAAIALLNVRRSEKTSSVKVETVASGLQIPWSISFISRDEAIFTERGGGVKLLTTSTGRVETVAMLGVAAVGEGGLLGVETYRAGSKTVVYLYHTYRVAGGYMNKVTRAFYDGGLVDIVDVVTDIPGGVIHNGGRVKIGPDRMLYITTGEGGRQHLSQDLQSLGGKILRLTLEGHIPGDNPFNSPVYAYGLRNPQGLAWRMKSRTMYCTDHGPSGEGLRFAHDEVNFIVKGGNYGWPTVIGDEAGPGLIKPLVHSGLETWAPSGCCVYESGEIQFLRDSLLYAALRGTHLGYIVLDYGGEKVVELGRLLDKVYGRLRDVVEGPDGALYVLTSNRDGRGNPTGDDDRILRLVAD